jgi:hypothetical protein
MYARVVNWEGGDADAIRRNAEQIAAQAADGAPEGLPAVGLMLLIEPEGGRSMAMTLYETEADMLEGDALLNTMSPPDDAGGTRSFVGLFEVAADIRL